MIDHLRYYHLETYLFEDVRSRFHAQGALSAFDFFSIVIWKANRAKSRIAHRLLRIGKSDDLREVVCRLSKSLFEADTSQERLRILMEDWGFLLPMASAVLTVLWPDDFTVYDIRACNELDGFHRLADKHWSADTWTDYQAFCATVRKSGSAELSLRDKDRLLWAKSAATQLEHDIEHRFSKP